MPLYEITTLAPATPDADEEKLRQLLSDCITNLQGEGATKQDEQLADRCQGLLDRLDDGEAAPKRLVDAQNPAQAVRHCAADMFSARLIRSPTEAVDLLGSGITVEKVAAD